LRFCVRSPLVIAASLATGVKLLLDIADAGLIRAVFQFVPARIAAAYWGVELDGGTLTFTVGEVSLAVTRSCAATDFFALALALLLVSRRSRRWAMPIAWVVTVLANSVRLILLVPVERLFPSAELPIAHLGIGVAVFLPTLIAIWYTVAIRKGKPCRSSPIR